LEQSRLPELRARLRLPLLAVLGTVMLGTVGYHLLWRAVGGSWLDALYMTVITLTTIGYGEVHPLDSTGRVFTMVLAVIGIANFFYLFGAAMDFLVATQLRDWRGRRKMEKEIEKLADHVIVVGLGRVGFEAARELSAAGSHVLAVDPSEEAVERAAREHIPVLRGDGTADAVLEHAGVGRARSLVACAGSDATNLYIVLSARLLNPRLNIVSRVVEEANEPKLLKAGANRAISPYAMGGRRLAHLILSPDVVELFETAMARKGETLDIEDIAVEGGGARLAGRTLGSLRKEHETATILCVVRDGAPLVRPGSDLLLRKGDHVLVFGTARQLANFGQGARAGEP
jgi:voltage-gated potassium channel